MVLSQTTDGRVFCLSFTPGLFFCLSFKSQYNHYCRPSDQGLCLWTRALRRHHCVGGGAPVNFGQRRRATSPKKNRRRDVGGQKCFFKGTQKNFVLSSKFSDDLFLVVDRKLQESKYTANMAYDKLLAAAARRSTKVGGSNKLLAVARPAQPAQGFTFGSLPHSPII